MVYERRQIFLLAAALLALSIATVRAQQSNLSYVPLNPCCIAVDAKGNNFIVSSGWPGYGELPYIYLPPPTISVTKMDSSGNILSVFPFQAGAGDLPAAAAVDPLGNLWIVGSTVSMSPGNAPTVGLIVKLDSTGTHLLYTGTFGGLDPGGATVIDAIAFDPGGNLYLAGSTGQLDFPVTPGAFITKIPTAGPAPLGAKYPGRPEYAFIAKLTPASQTIPPYTPAYSTLLGGQQVVDPLPCPNSGSCYPLLPGTAATMLAVDSNGVATVSGTTSAADFPVTPGAFQTQFQGGDNTPDVFVTRLNAQGTGLVWSTLLGEGGNISLPSLGGMALDSGGNVVVAGITLDPSFPISSGAIQAQFAAPQAGAYSPGNGFVAKLDSTGVKLLFSTFYGVTQSQSAPPALRLDAQGDIWIAESLADPSSVVLHPNSLVLGSALIAELAPDGSSVLFSELLPDGVAGQDLVLNPDGSLTVIGPPRVAGFGPISNGFALRLPRGTPTGVSILGVADSAANAVTVTVAPGEYVSIYGTGLGPATGIGMQIDSNGRVASSLGGTQVSIDGVFAPLIYAAQNQINMLVPYEIAGSTQVNMTITTDAGMSQILPLHVVAAQPNIFAVLNSDGSLNSPSNPASPGATVSMLVSGAGALNPSLPDGTIATSPAPTPALAIEANFSYSVFQIFGYGLYGENVTPTYAGGIPGMVIDLLRVDVPVPATLNCSASCSIGIEVGNAGSSATGLSVAAAN
ncbi:MAG: hypothetical protein ABSE42_19745 [Bryobacteraceae bacterium]|jgi:uncharacterized protein (TIGR03437 family)